MRGPFLFVEVGRALEERDYDEAERRLSELADMLGHDDTEVVRLGTRIKLAKWRRDYSCG